jgi:hypothetical protein
MEKSAKKIRMKKVKKGKESRSERKRKEKWNRAIEKSNGVQRSSIGRREKEGEQGVSRENPILNFDSLRKTFVEDVMCCCCAGDLHRLI